MKSLINGFRGSLILFFALCAFAATAQTVPNSVIWGNTKTVVRTTANDTVGYATLDQLKTFIGFAPITLASNTTGTDVGFSAATVGSGGTITLQVPDASATNRGVINIGNQSIGSTGTTKTFTGGATVTQTLTVSGGYVDGTVSLSANTTLTTANNTIFADATTPFTLTLPTTPTSGFEIKIIRTNATGNLTIARGGTNTIEGATSVVVASPISTRLKFNGTTWYYMN